MKALVIGCGSIGRRHVSNLIASSRIESVIVCTRNQDCLKDIDAGDKVETIASLETVEADFAIIANDTDKHLETALRLAGMGMDLFIEKPLSHNTDNIDLLKDMAEAKGIRISLGYNLRFLGIMEQIKELLSKSSLGKLYFAKIEVGQYLPLWREGTDYRNSYSVSADRGGGVALDLSHELDYMRYFFGEPLSWKVVRAKAGDLEMNAEDIFEGIYNFDGGFTCNVHMDCLQKNAKRYIRIEGEKGSIFCDLISKELRLSIDTAETVINNKNMFDMNKTYIDELDHFMDVVENRSNPAVTLQDGIEVLKLIKDN